MIHFQKTKQLTTDFTKSHIFVLPTMVTCGSLICGFASVVLAVLGYSGHSTVYFLQSCYAIIVAMLCDGLDGSIARATNTQSEFGGEMDSLCDAISFCFAPAVMIYYFALHAFGRVGFVVSFVYLLCGVLRLARFNVLMKHNKSSGNFMGVPTPLGAAGVVSLVWLQISMDAYATNVSHIQWIANIWLAMQNFHVWQIFIGLYVFILALAMVSNFEYKSTKTLRIKQQNPFKFLVYFLVSMSFLWILPTSLVFFILSFIYLLHGPVNYMLFRKDYQKEEETIFDSDLNWKDITNEHL
jgi:CDP-diacylglycerol---serine O-phosphatidyltransferase